MHGTPNTYQPVYHDVKRSEYVLPALAMVGTALGFVGLYFAAKPFERVTAASFSVLAGSIACHTFPQKKLDFGATLAPIFEALGTGAAESGMTPEFQEAVFLVVLPALQKEIRLVRKAVDYAETVYQRLAGQERKEGQDQEMSPELVQKGVIWDEKKRELTRLIKAKEFAKSVLTPRSESGSSIGPFSPEPGMTKH